MSNPTTPQFEPAAAGSTPSAGSAIRDALHALECCEYWAKKDAELHGPSTELRVVYEFRMNTASAGIKALHDALAVWNRMPETGFVETPNGRGERPGPQNA